jgi:plasmid stabilization system protein ParE
MEVHFTPEVKAKLEEMAQESGCAPSELVEDAVIGYFDIREYIAEDGPDAAERTITEIFDRIRALVASPHQGYRRPTSLRVRCGSRWCDRFCPRKENIVGCCRISRTAQPPCNSRSPTGQRVKQLAAHQLV